MGRASPSDPSQPVEDWLGEPEFFENSELTQAHFTALLLLTERVLFDTAALQFVTQDAAQSSNDLIAIYQVWAFQLPESNPAAPVSPGPHTGMPRSRSFIKSACDDVPLTARFANFSPTIRSCSPRARRRCSRWATWKPRENCSRGPSL